MANLTTDEAQAGRMTHMDLIFGDCLDIMPGINDASIDMILTDLPYGRTRNRWDTVIPFTLLWAQYERIIKDNGAIALFGDGMFMADLMASNRKLWRYNLVWAKGLATGFLNANRQPLRAHEEICIFYKKQPTYNPQKIKGAKNHSRGAPKSFVNNTYGEFSFVDNREILDTMKHPTSVLKFQKPHPATALHPTEKPVALLEWLIRSYTNPGETVLDSTMGSGSTGEACIRTERNFIGIEADKAHYATAVKRLNNG